MNNSDNHNTTTFGSSNPGTSENRASNSEASNNSGNPYSPPRVPAKIPLSQEGNHPSDNLPTSTEMKHPAAEYSLTYANYKEAYYALQKAHALDVRDNVGLRTERKDGN